MKAIFTILFFCLFFSCTDNKYPAAENALDAGREFVDACLKGNFDEASFYMINDSVNNLMLDKLHQSYNQDNASTKQQYKDASIEIDQEETLNDSTHIIYYKNSYDHIAHKLKVSNSKGIWQVDFKYTFDGNL